MQFTSPVFEQKYTGNVVTVVKGGCVIVVTVTESLLRPGIERNVPLYILGDH